MWEITTGGNVGISLASRSNLILKLFAAAFWDFFLFDYQIIAYLFISDLIIQLVVSTK